MSYAMKYFRQSGLEELVDSGKIDTVPISEVVDIVKHYIKNRREITAAQSNDPLSIFSKKIDDKQLMIDALFYNKIFVPDPVVADCGNAALLFPGIPLEKSDPTIALREEVKRAVDFYKHYSPLINDGIIVPITISNEVKQIPFLIPSEDFSKNIPPHLLEFLISSTKVNSCQSVGPNRLAFLPKQKNETQPSNVILIDIFGEQMLYQLSEITSFRQKSDNDFNVAIKLVEQNAVTETKFVNWVNQSIIQTIQNILNSLQKSIHISASLGCSYQTNSHCEKKILEQSCGVVKNAPVNFLNVNLQHIKTFCPSEISKFREKHAKYFSRFQSTIQETTFDLRNLSAEDFKAKANFKLRNEIYPQVEEIKNHLKGNLIIDAAISAAATGINLAIAISSGGSLSVASVLAFLASGAALPIGKHIKEYYDSKKMPEFIWAQLLR